MSSAQVITLLCALILLVLAVRTYLVMRQEKDHGKIRGSAPGKGHHTIHAEYSSGLGGHSVSYKVPRDPQEYNQLYVPKSETERPD